MSNVSYNTNPNLEKYSKNFKKKKIWRNLFLLSLSITIFLIGLFWLPLKAIEVNNFMNQPSVNLPEKGEITEKASLKPLLQKKVHLKNMLPTHMALINASSETDWIYFSLLENDAVKIQDTSSLEWDLAFRRGKVITNGGVINKFGMAGAIDLGEKDFDTLSEVPASAYLEDIGTRTEPENKALKSWYKYNYFTHKLTAKKNIYAIRTAKGKFAKVQFLSFYCANKETGCIKMQFVLQTNGTNSFLSNIS